MEFGLALGLTKTRVEDLAVLRPLQSPHNTTVTGLRNRDELAATNIRSLAANVAYSATQGLNSKDLAVNSNALTRRLYTRPTY